MHQLYNGNEHTSCSKRFFLFPGVIDCLFSKLEEEHGCVFVSHTLGYITATRYGLTECELLDILTCDLEVDEHIKRGR